MSLSNTFLFPKKELTKIIGRPSYQSMFLLQKELSTNARSVNSMRGGGISGHLALVLSAADYLTKTGHPFVAPVHPGPNPIHAAGTSGPVITATDRNHDAAFKEFVLYQQVATELKSQVMAAVDEQYYSELEDGMDGFAGISVLDFLTHLWTVYGKVKQSDSLTNLKKLERDFDPSDPLEILWSRIKDIQQFAIAAKLQFTTKWSFLQHLLSWTALVYTPKL